ncbi:LacI family transcriptional regulator [Chryseomicrobium aureum]|uniref:LacI family DNA-binding transcriptional regulator n=1 Tax=Chryseomicrobium aureum TaxID=1441723 RepID=UPI00195844E8|nr:LacI family DNA-binding transcriptional regulator [Chryseomicrobium aureum]MBM7706007.1 LacI family transcriptional regulator [Chryseomicrobium aureum]
MATIRDVAKHAGVSVATVSRYLNAKGYVSVETAQAVQKAISELNYEMNAVARSLTTKQSNLIGLILPDITNPFFPELARAVEDVALTYGYTVVLCNSDENPVKERNYIETLEKKYVAGFIVTSSQQNRDLYMKLKKPMVALDRPIDASIPCVISSNRQGVKDSTKSLIASGCKELLFVEGPDHIQSASERKQGFEEAMLGVTDVAHHHIQANFHFDESYEKVKAYLTPHKEVDGIVTSSDVAALGAIRACTELGLHIPSDIQIIGFDGIQLGEMLSPPLSTVRQDIYKLGAMAARILIKQVENEPLEKMYYEVPVEIVHRGTTRSETS